MSLDRFPDCCNVVNIFELIEGLCLHAYVWMVQVRCKCFDKSPEGHNDMLRARHL